MARFLLKDHHGPVQPERTVDFMALPLNGATPETILVVEDDASILRLVQLILEAAGFEVLGAGSAKTALQVEARFPRAIHLLLSDIMMPDMRGPELAEALKQLRPQMRVMMMSGCADGAMLVLNHSWHFIQKPFLVTALVGRVHEVLRAEICDQGASRFDRRE
jgi:two-component system cell cycle sensor histidine kinase/response regulator CckA